MQMRIAVGVAVLGVACLMGGRSQELCTVTIKVVDAESGRELSALLRIRDADSKRVEPSGLLNRGLGLDDSLPICDWWVLPGRKALQLPKTKVTIEAVSGLETEATTVSLDLSEKSTAEVTLPLTRFYRAASKGIRSGNTHLHLQKITREQCDRYLQQVPPADGLDVVFLSYLERAVADKQYTSNHYTAGDLAALERNSRVVFGNGEEHRHNFTGFGEGYGHVMLLNIEELIQPVSIGPGIMQRGTDGIPLQRGIDSARRDGATIVWCHNNWGLEAASNFFTGRVDAQNIFDGGVHGSYKDSFYRYLNAGLDVPFSTGTDWFMYDFSRVYVDLDGDVTVESWLEGLKAGRNYITNGPLLEFSVNGKSPGGKVELKRPAKLEVEGRAFGRSDFGRIELVMNGEVVSRAKTRPVGKHFEAKLSLDLPIEAACWLALRTPPPPVKDDPVLTEPVGRNLLGRELFAHTSAVSVEMDGRRYADRQVLAQLLAEMQADSRTIAERAKFADDQERARVLDVYEDAALVLERLQAAE